MNKCITDWFKNVTATNKSATSIQDLFHYTWLARYPWPQFIIFDSGSVGKFKREFKQICIKGNHGIKAKPTTSHNHWLTSKCNHWENTQSWVLSIIFSDHLTWKTIMKIYKNKMILNSTIYFNKLHGYYAITSTYHTTLYTKPYWLVFGRDMIQNISFRENCDWIQKQK
jgi:hypothetical protein